MANGSTVTFSGETENYTFSKEVNLSKDLVFPQSQMAVINLSIGKDNYTAKTAETRIFVEGFDKVETTKTQLQPSVTGALGTGVTEALAYTYSSKNTNLRFNNNGHSSTNPYLYISAANDNLIISNIKISGETALKFSYQAKTNSGSATITINYKESSSDVWTKVGTSTAKTGTFDPVNAKVFNVSSEATSIDIQIVGSAAALVDDLVLESFSEGGSETVKLAAPTVSCTAQTETSLTFSWAAVSNASGYQVSTDGGSTYGDTQTATTYTWEGLTASTTKTLYVKAIGDGTNYTDSDAATATGTTTSGGSTGGETVTLFSESFGDNSNSARAWSDSYKEQGGISSVYSGSTYTITNAKQSKNTVGKTKSGLAQSTQNKDAIFEIKSLNVAAYSDLSVSYYWKAGSIRKTYSTSLYYSKDGGTTYTEVNKTQGTGATNFVEVKYTLPADAVSSNLCLKVVFNTSNTQAVIDDFVLKGKK